MLHNEFTVMSSWLYFIEFTDEWFLHLVNQNVIDFYEYFHINIKPWCKDGIKILNQYSIQIGLEW